MPKNIEDIIIPEKPDRRSIRNIPIPEKRRATDFSSRTSTQPSREPERLVYTQPIQSEPIKRESEPPRMRIPEQEKIERMPVSNKRYYSRKTLWMGAVMGLIVVAVAVFSLFSGATLAYIPKSATVSFNKDVYTAYKTDRPGELTFSVIKLAGEKGIEAPASGEENVSVKASGKIIVYNSGSNTSEKLIKNTRFESPDGKIFRTPSDVVIPGKKGTTPGSVEITVYADQPGTAYNIPLSDFTVPGLKGDPRFQTIYARSKTPMTGGFVGLSKKVSEEDLTKAKSTIESSLREELLTQAKAEVPEDFVLYPNLVEIVFTSLPQSSSTASGVTINEHAEFYGVMFKKNDLARYLTSKKLSSGLPEPVSIADLSTLDITFAGQNASDLLKAESIMVEVSGDVTAASTISEENLKKDLSGVKKAEVHEILKKYPGIESANATLRPFWKTAFPSDSSQIKVTKNLAK